MEILIDTKTGKEVNRWDTPPKRINIPGTTDVIFPGDTQRPLNISKDHLLITPTIVTPPKQIGEKYGQETVSIDVAGKTVVITTPAIVKEKEEFVSAIKDEAERRIDIGTTINGTQIRCDELTVSRVHGMVTAGSKDPTKTWVFMTSGGVKFTVDKAMADGMFNAIEAHIANMLTTSATLQESIATMTPAELAAFDPTNNINWN